MKLLFLGSNKHLSLGTGNFQNRSPLKKHVLLNSTPGSPLYEKLLRIRAEKKQIKLKAHLQLRKIKTWSFEE